MQHKRLLEEQGERERWQRTWAACREREIHEGSEGSGMKTCMFLIGRCPWFDKNFKVYEPQWHEPKRQSRHQARKQHQSDYHHNIYVESWRSRRLVSHLLASLATFDYNQQQQSKTQWTTKAIDKILNSCVEDDSLPVLMQNLKRQSDLPVLRRWILLWTVLLVRRRQEIRIERMSRIQSEAKIASFFCLSV